MKRQSLVIGAFFAAVLVGACGSDSQESSSVQELPNSLADASAHVTKRDIPSYGPQHSSIADSSRDLKAHGQVLYVPIYSHIFYRGEDREFNLAVTLSIRNTSPSSPLLIQKVDYFNSEGTLLKSYLGQPRSLGPLASTYVVIEEEDRSGGVGANFIVEWEGSQPISPPLVESVMISTASTQGISFTSSARVLQEW